MPGSKRRKEDTGWENYVERIFVIFTPHQTVLRLSHQGRLMGECVTRVKNSANTYTELM
jgi:hypothetical protein